MSDFEEHLRELHSGGWHRTESIPGRNAEEEFDRWLAKVKADAIREVADAVEKRLEHAYGKAGFDRRARESLVKVRQEADRIELLTLPYKKEDRDLQQALFRVLYDSGVSFESAVVIPRLTEAIRLLGFPEDKPKPNCAWCDHPEAKHHPTATETWCITGITTPSPCDCPGYNPNSKLRVAKYLITSETRTQDDQPGTT